VHQLLGKEIMQRKWAILTTLIYCTSILWISFHNVFWQILDDGTIINNDIFPPWGNGARAWRQDIGRDYSGFGIYWKLISILSGQEELFVLHLLSAILFVVTISLALRVLITRKTKKVTIFVAVLCLTFIPTGPENVLTQLKLEKWTILSVLILLLGLRSFTQKNKFPLLIGSVCAVALSKETFLIYLLCILAFYSKYEFPWRSWKLFLRSKTFFILILLFIFSLVRLYPFISEGTKKNYTSSFELSTTNAHRLFLSYAFRNPYTIFVLVIALSILILDFKNIFTNERFKNIGILLTGSLFEFLFLILFWNQGQMYYLYSLDFFSCLGIFLWLNNRTLSLGGFLNFFLVGTLALIFSFGALLTVERANSMIQVHKLDGIAISILTRSPLDFRSNFPEDSEMYSNIALIVNRSKKLNEERTSKISCPMNVAVAYGKPDNIVMGFRGVDWPTADQGLQNMKKMFPASASWRLVRSLNFSHTYFLPGLFMPDARSTFLYRPYNFEYGWNIFRVDC